MTLYAFVSEIWKMIKDYIWLIVGTIIVVIVASFGIQYMVSTFLTDTGNESGLEEDNTLNQVGVISLHADSDFENIRLDPELDPELIEEIKTMRGFSTDFAVNTNTEDEVTGESGEEPDIDLESFETANFLDLLLGVDPTQHTQLYQDPETGNLLMSLEIDTDSGDVKLIEAGNALDVIEVQLDVAEEAETGDFDFPTTDADLMNVGWNFSPNGEGEQMMTFSAVYDLVSGMNYPIQLNDNRKNITVANPTPFSPIITSTQNGFNLRAVIIQVVVMTFGGALLGVGLAFVLAILSHTIKYSFTYGWDADELFLQFDEKDSEKLMAHDMLVSDKNNVAIVSENQIDASLVKELTDTSKRVNIYNSIEQLDVSDKVEEIVLVVQRNLTSKEWYRKQRKHIRAYRDIDVKIAEL